MLRVANVAENLARSSAFLCIVAKEMVKNFRIKSFSKINHAFLLFFFLTGHKQNSFVTRTFLLVC